jgi:hypothetical protein
LIEDTAQRSEGKEEKLEKDRRYRHRAYGRCLRDSIRKKNVARGFDPRIAYEHSGGTMIDHIYLPVTDLKRSGTFYGAMLGPLGKSERWNFKAQAGYAGAKVVRTFSSVTSGDLYRRSSHRFS